MAGMGIIYLFFIFLIFLVSVAIMRWAFRVNDIVKRLDTLIELQGGNKTAENVKPKSFMDGIKKGMDL